jgi:bacteriocin biosynthesis cyclodehydratase domain-containing protein
MPESSDGTGRRPTAEDGAGGPRLRLRPGATILELSADELAIGFPNYTVTFTSPPVVRGIRALVEALDPPAAAGEAVRRAAAATGLEEPFLASVLELLRNEGCVGQGSDHTGPGGDLAEFFAYLGDGSEEAMKTLAEAPILALSAARSSAELEAALSSAGLRAQVLPLAPGTSCGAGLEAADRILGERRSTLVVWGFPYRLPFARLVNDVAIRRRLPVLFGACEGVVGRVGPYVIPKNTACLECLNSRLLAHAGAPELRAFKQYRARFGDRIPDPWPTHPAFERTVASLLAVELSQIVLKRSPSTAGGILELSFADRSLRRHGVHKVPRCPSCQPGRPPRLAWDTRFSAPTIKSASE